MLINTDYSNNIIIYDICDIIKLRDTGQLNDKNSCDKIK